MIPGFLSLLVLEFLQGMADHLDAGLEVYDRTVPGSIPSFVCFAVLFPGLALLP